MAPSLRALVATAWLALAAEASVERPWLDRSLPLEDRVGTTVASMTLDEKLAMLHGPPACNGPACPPYVGNVPAIRRLGIPPINMGDGPQGFRDPRLPGTSTAWPSGLAMAASWDPDAVLEWGKGMGREFYDKGSNVQLGPGLCLARVPRNGRNFEYLAGEDPYLGYVLAKAAVSGIQSQRVVANAKHWAMNSQEANRTLVSEHADERTRFELYYPPFEGAIEAGVGSFMCSYNKINDAYSCENPETLARDLKRTLGFRGYVMSDWGATHSASLAQGLDMEMPGAYFMNSENLKAALAAGIISEESIGRSVARILRPMFQVGVMDEPLSAWDSSKMARNVTTAGSLASARKLSALSTVLLKNERGLLPLPQGKRLALLGFAGSNAVVRGGGSGLVEPSYLVQPLEGIRAAAGAGAQVSFLDGTNLEAATVLAAAADYAIVFVGTTSTEGEDRKSLSLDDGCDPTHTDGQCTGNAHEQNAMVEAVAMANPMTVVVASVPGAVLLPWAEMVPAILTNFMPGQQVGNAIADVLFGSVNPSAKLPLTFPQAGDEPNLTPAQYPGLQTLSNYYTERLLVGYRFYDAHGIQPLFPFGHGLSYTAFEYSELAVGEHSVSFAVRNSGKLPGAEVAQLYLGFPAPTGEPPAQLKGFRKTRVLQPSEVERVTLPLTQRTLSIWNTTLHAWSRTYGTFKVMVGASSRDIRLQGELWSLPPEAERLI